MPKMKRLLIVIIFLGAAVTGLVLGNRWSHSESAPNSTINPENTVTNTIQQPAGMPDLEAQAAILIKQDSGEVICEKSAQKRSYPASTTKVLTALLAIENCSMDELISVGEEVRLVPTQSSKAGLQPGDKLSMRDLLNALMVPSGNDAAYTLAVHVARGKNAGQVLSSREALDCFSDMMNKRAQDLGAVESHFTNPDGYHHLQHYSTARDLALIAREAMKYSYFRQAVGAANYPIKLSGARGTVRKLSWKNTNELIDPESPHYFREATGIKTGHTTEAGYCLVSSGSRSEHGLIAVVLNSSKEGVFTDSSILLNYGFDNYPVAQVGKQGVAVHESFLEQWRIYVGVLALTGLYIGVRLLGHRKKQNA